MKKIISIIGDAIGFYLVALVVSVIYDKIRGLDTSIWIYAIYLTVGWEIWQLLKLGFKKVKKKNIDSNL